MIVFKEAKKIMEPTWIPTWIVAISTVAYTMITGLLILGQRKSRLDDKFPCIVVRSRFSPLATDKKEWTIRLVNISRGPAFIEYFHTIGLGACSRKDGDNTDDIDKVIGPDMGDPDLQVAFAMGHPERLRSPEVKIVIHYRDIAGRLFKSRLIAGKPEYERPPWYGHWLDKVFVFLHLKG